jgi:hypothetical protein
MNFLSKSTLVIATGLIWSNLSIADNLNNYIPKNRILHAKVMALVSSKEVEPIAAKLKVELSKHTQWLTQYLKNRQPGQPLPYHPNFGITKAEYNTLLQAANQIQLMNTGNIDVEFQQREPGVITVKTTNPSPINGLRIEGKTVTTPYGKTTVFADINNTDKDSATGAWKGVQWRLTDFDEAAIGTQSLDKIKGKEVKFAVGKLSKTGEGILYYSVKDIDLSQHKNINLSYIIYFPSEL